MFSCSVTAAITAPVPLTSAKAPLKERQPLATRQNNRQIAPVPQRRSNVYTEPERVHDEIDDMDIDRQTGKPATTTLDMVEIDDEITVGGMSDELEGDLDDEYDDDDWLRMSEEEALMCREELDMVRSTFQDDIDMFDTTMVAEYADEIFGHMEQLEVREGRGQG